MNDLKNDSLAKAIAYLGAVEVAPGKFTAFKDGRGQWRGLKPEAFRVDPDRMGGRDVYYNYCRVYASFAMPAWWSPEQRFAYRSRTTGYVYPPFTGQGQDPASCYPAFERITADLETGEEVPA